MKARINKNGNILRSQMRCASPRRVTLNLGIRPIDARLYPPWAPFGEKDNLLAGTGSDDPAFDHLQIVRTTLRFACGTRVNSIERAVECCFARQPFIMRQNASNAPARDTLLISATAEHVGRHGPNGPWEACLRYREKRANANLFASRPFAPAFLRVILLRPHILPSCRRNCQLPNADYSRGSSSRFVLSPIRPDAARARTIVYNLKTINLSESTARHVGGPFSSAELAQTAGQLL